MAKREYYKNDFSTNEQKGEMRMKTTMKEKIIRSMLGLLQTQGLKFTMDDIVRDLRISKSTLYNNFKSRDALFEAMIDYLFETLDAEEREVLKSDASLDEKLISIISVFPREFGVFQNHVYQSLMNMPAVYDKIHAHNQQRFEHFNEYLDKGVEDGLVREDIPRDVFFHLLLLAQRGMTDPNVLASFNMTYRDAVNESLKIMLHGIMTDEGQHQTESV